MYSLEDIDRKVRVPMVSKNGLLFQPFSQREIRFPCIANLRNWRSKEILKIKKWCHKVKRRHRIAASFFMLKRKKVKSVKKVENLEKHRVLKSAFSFFLFCIVTSYFDKAKVESLRFPPMPKIWKLLALKILTTCVKSDLY